MSLASHQQLTAERREGEGGRERNSIEGEVGGEQTNSHITSSHLPRQSPHLPCMVITGSYHDLLAGVDSDTERGGRERG